MGAQWADLRVAVEKRTHSARMTSRQQQEAIPCDGIGQQAVVLSSGCAADELHGVILFITHVLLALTA